MSGSGDSATRPLEVDVDVEAERTVVTVTGDRDAAVVVSSAAGERIYLPPAVAGGENEADPYRPGGGDTPYEGGRSTQTPYGSSPRADPSVGLHPTADGFRILHPEPVHDVRLLCREDR